MGKNVAKIKKLLILGSGGMLAADLVKVFEGKEKYQSKADKPRAYKLIAWGMKDLDITDEKAVMEKITKQRPDIIINAAAYTAVDAAEKNIEKAMNVNGYALRSIAEAAAETGALLIHYSTDYVFDGKNPAGYKEDDEPNSASAYGQSKFVGEQMILMTAFHNSGASCGGCGAGHGCHKIKAMKPLKYYIIRTSWLYGKNGNNFVEAMLSLADKTSEIRVVDDQFGKPTYTVDLAKKTKEMAESKLDYGIYHFTDETGKKGISWYDFAREIFSAKGGSLPTVQAGASGGKMFKKIKVIPVSTKEFYKGNKSYLAKRPKFSMLVNSKLPKARDWKEALGEYLLEHQASK